MTTRRIQNLKDSMKSESIDCMAIIPGNSFLYFTGMRVLLHERPMIILINSEGKNAFLLPGLELPSASAVLDDKDYDYYTYTDEEGYWKAQDSDVIGVDIDAIRITEDRQKFRDLMESIGLDQARYRQPSVTQQRQAVAHELERTKRLAEFTLDIPLCLAQAGFGGPCPPRHSELQSDVPILASPLIGAPVRCFPIRIPPKISQTGDER